MAQRFCEVVINNSEDNWKEQDLQDGNDKIFNLNDATLQPSAGGEVLSQEGKSLAVHWRCYDRTLEVLAESFSRTFSSGNIRITCDSSMASGVSFCLVRNQLQIFCASQFAVHIVTASISDSETNGIALKSSESYPMSMSSPLIHCSARSCATHGVIFSVVNEEGRNFAVIIKNGVYSEVELKQASIINKIWSKVRRSMKSGPDDNEQIVYTQVVDELQSVYSLSRNLCVRRWCFGTWDCLNEWNVSSFIGLSLAKGQSFKIIGNGTDMLMCVHVTDNSQNKLMISTMANGALTPDRILLDCDENEVISYDIMSNKVFVLWRDVDGEYVVQYMLLTDSEQGWSEVYLRQPMPSSIEVEDYEDPREAYCMHIFKPAKFSQNALLKSISILKPELSSLTTAANTDLKKITCEAIYDQVCNLVTTNELTNAEYRQLHSDTWRKFYSDLIQYEETYTIPLGLCCGGKSFPIAVIKKGSVSYLRTCEPLEQQILFPSDPLDMSQALDQDVVTFMQALSLFQSAVPGYRNQVYQSLLSGSALPEIINETVQSLVARNEHGNLKRRLASYVQNTQLLKESLEFLQMYLNLANTYSQNSNSHLLAEVPAGNNPIFLMNSTGRRLVCNSVHDVVYARFCLCCDVSLFLNYLCLLAEEVAKSEVVRSNIEELSTTFNSLLHCYATLLWITRLTVNSPDVDISSALMETLRITSSGILEHVTSSEFGVPTMSPFVLENYLSNVGGCRVKAHLISTADPASYYEYVNLLVVAICQALWPDTTDTTFAEYLLVTKETASLYAYFNLLDAWCKGSAAARSFLKGHCFLLESEPQKAFACFMSAIYGMFDEDGNQNQTANQKSLDDIIKGKQQELCFKAINLFEECCYSEQVIQMSYQTLRFSDSQQSTIWTKIFKHSLDLKRYEDAFKSMLNNPDTERKMDCLRQFVSTLCDNGELSTLASYPYKDISTQQDLRPAVVSILLSKARSVDLTHRNYYDLLYAFHVVNNDLLSAANVMYECCERISVELTGLAALQKRAKCYLACITALHCVPETNAWIVPNVPAENAAGRKSPKRSVNGADKKSDTVKSQLMTVDDIEREYLLINMALRLASNGSKQVTGLLQLDASEIVSLLCSIGMFDDAVIVSKRFGLTLQTIFESLAFRCVRLAKDRSASWSMQDTDETTKWLSYNKPVSGHLYSSPCDQAWKLLRHYLEQHESVSTLYHKVVANKLLSNSVSLPNWFQATYQKMNVAELVRVYLTHDNMEEAVHVLSSMLDSLTSADCDRFGYESPLSATMAPASVWVPYTLVDNLLSVLYNNRHDPYYNELYIKLKTSVDKYSDELTRKSKDMEFRLTKTSIKPF